MERKRKLKKKSRTTKKVWTKLRNGLFGWRVRGPGVGKTSEEKQTGAELGSAKSGTPDISKYKLDVPPKSMPRGKSINIGISIKRKYEIFESVNNQHSGWENNARDGVDIERESLTDSD